MSLIAGSYERFLFGYKHPDSLKDRVRIIYLFHLCIYATERQSCCNGKAVGLRVHLGDVIVMVNN